MTEPKSPKKSETLEVRIPHPTKAAFMDKARAEGKVASEIVREQIDAYLGREPEPRTVREKAAALVRKHMRGAVLLLAGAGSAIAISLAVSPATAQPDLQAAFVTLDADGDGVVSLSEFTDPRDALTTDIQSALPPTGERVAVAPSANSGTAYIRIVLDTGSEDGVLPLMLMVDLPEGGMKAGDFERLIGKAFTGLDRDGNGLLSADEFGVS
jgi:hypothetical protein